MTDVFAFTSTSQPMRLVDQVNNLTFSLARQNIHVSDMSRAGTLESGIGTDASGTLDDGAGSGPIELDRLEGRIVGRKIDVAPPGASRFRFFLDGSQKTVPVCRIGLAPVVAALSAVGILLRTEGGQPSLLPDFLRVNQAWIVPRQTGDRELDRLIHEIEDRGGTVLDPFASRSGRHMENYTAFSCDYGKMLSSAFDMAGRIRSQQEQDILESWQATVSPDRPDDWIVVDGRLRSNVPHAIGLVKDLQTQHLSGDEAVALFDLPQGHRTSAFRYVSSAWEAADLAGPATPENRTMWYMRLWNATGMDARHSLVRVEAPHHIATSDQIDELSGWILAERLPRATDDPRWPTLLYPIYYLERILKRRLSEMTTGWPSA